MRFLEVCTCLSFKGKNLLLNSQKASLLPWLIVHKWTLSTLRFYKIPFCSSFDKSNIQSNPFACKIKEGCVCVFCERLVKSKRRVLGRLKHCCKETKVNIKSDKSIICLSLYCRIRCESWKIMAALCSILLLLLIKLLF